MGEGSHCLSSFIESMRGEKDPRCLLVALEVLKLLQEHCPAETVSSLAEQLFDATACYFPVTFTPPPNDKHGITRDDLANALLEVQLGHSAMMPFLMPMLVDKIASSAVQAQLAAMKTAGVALERFGVAAAASQLSGLSGELFRAAVEGAEELVSEMALKCFTQVGALLAAQGGAREWKDFAGAAIGSAMSELEITPDSMLARSGVKVMFAIAVSSAHGLREVLAAAVAPLICLQAEAHTAGARSAALGALALLIGAVNDTVDFWPSPVAPYMDVLYSQLVGVLQSSDASQEDICVAIAGLSALVIRPPSALVETEKVKHLVESFTSMIIEEGASPAVGEARITEASSARVALNSLLAIGGRRDEYQQLMLVTSLEPLLEGIRALGKYKSAQVLPGLGRLLQAVCELCLLERVFCLAVPTLLDLSLEGWGPASAAILATLATALRDRKHNKGGVLEFTQGGALMRLVGAAEEGLLPDSEGCLVSAASICSTCTQSLPLEAQDELAAAMLQRRWQEVQGKGTRPLLALATAVLASLSQESVVLRSEELLGGVMQSLVNVASEGAEAQATDVVAAAKCVAAILNKVPEGPLLDRAVATVMAAAAGSSSTAPPVDLIAWSLKGALLRGMAHKELLESLCALLAGSAGDEIAMRAAGGVTTIMAEARDVLSLDCNALVSPFWRQRLFGEMFPRLSAAHGNRPAPLLGMLHLAKSVPKAVLEPVLDDALDAAVEGLRTKDVAPLVCAALDTLQVLCKDWPSALAACLAELIPLLLELAQSHAKARARLLALRGLMEVTKLPQGQLYPFKARVIK
ncbi:unnamed protein product [Chrysoparadoxa australica]